MVKAAVPENEREQRLRETLVEPALRITQARRREYGCRGGQPQRGWRKRLAIAEALFSSRTSCCWTNQQIILTLKALMAGRFARAANFAFIVVAHDRYFLETWQLKSSS